MFPAALRFALVAPLLLAVSAAAESPSRTVPTRPAGPLTNSSPRPPAMGRLSSLSVTRLGGVEYVSLREAAALMGLKVVWLELERRLILSDPTTKVEFEADSRGLVLNGLRLFLGRPVVLRNGAFYVSRVDFERGLVARLRPALLSGVPARPKVIALDPGHGGNDNGMENKRLGLKEKVLTLEVALRLQKLLIARGYKVVLTRTDDRQLAPDKPTDFRKRADIANRAGADLFVSIHFNSLYPDTKTSGTETYTFTPQNQRSDRAWSPAEPDDTEREAMPVNRFDPWSALLGQLMHREVIGALKTLDRGQKTMHSAVMRGLNCPAVLVESIFLSNDGEAKQAASAEGRQQIAEALAAGIGAYADTVSALQPKPPGPGAVSP